MILENDVAGIIAASKDPMLGWTAEEMGIRASIQITPGCINLIIKGNFPTYPLVNSLIPVIEERLKTHYPGVTLNISLDFLIKSHRTQLVNKGLRGVKNVIAVASGKGGVGKSTLAVNLAVALAQAGARVGILDADIYGPSIPMMLGREAEVLTEDNHYHPVSAFGIQAMSIGYLTSLEQALIWRGPMLAKALLQLLDLTLWSDLDYLFIDLPPGTGDIQLSLVQKIPLTAAIVVTTPQTVATIEAQKAIQMFLKTQVDVLGVVENMATHLCSNCGHEEAIFGVGGGEALSASYQIPFLGRIPLAQAIRAKADEGIPAMAAYRQTHGQAFMETALRAAIELSRKPLNYSNAFPPIRVEP